MLDRILAILEKVKLILAKLITPFAFIAGALAYHFLEKRTNAATEQMKNKLLDKLDKENEVMNEKAKDASSDWDHIRGKYTDGTS